MAFKFLLMTKESPKFKSMVKNEIIIKHLSRMKSSNIYEHKLSHCL